MNQPLCFQAAVLNGKVNWRDPAGIAKYIAVLEKRCEGKRGGCQVLITIEEHFDKRSLSQNSYAHVVFTYISEATGHEVLEVKEFMKAMFLSRPDRCGKMRVRGTSSLNRREMSEFIEAVIRWAAIFLELEIPPAENCPEAWAA